MTDSLISFNHVYKKYPASSGWIIEDFHLQVNPGEFFCLLGPSGSGKSTVLKLASGLELPTSGQISEPPAPAMVFQSAALFPWLNVFDNTTFGLRMSNRPNSQIKNLGEKYLQMMGLTESAKKYPRELSGGQQQRVGIARALCVESPLLLLDEPFSSLDPVTTQKLHQDLLKIWQDTGKTILMVSHSVEEALILADWIGIIAQGKIITTMKINLPRPRTETVNFFNELTKIRRILFKNF